MQPTVNMVFAGLHVHELEVIVRMVLATACGAAIGFERELKDRPAGLRTHMLVALAAAVFTLITFEILNNSSLKGEGGDPIRIITAVTSGVAFLSAGAIIRSGSGDVTGLTTGAGMWAAGAVGLACGCGLYFIAIVATLLALAIITLVQRFETHVLGTKEQVESKTDHNDT